MPFANSTYPLGAAQTVAGGLDNRAQEMLEALLRREHGNRPMGGPVQVPTRTMGPGQNLLRSVVDGPSERINNRSPLPNVNASEGGMMGKRWFAGGFNMSPGYLDAVSPNSSQIVSPGGPSPAGLGPSVPTQRPQEPDERPDFYGLNSRFAAMLAASQRR